MQREILKYLHDILESIHSIYEFLGENKDFNLYKSNKFYLTDYPVFGKCISMPGNPPGRSRLFR